MYVQVGRCVLEPGSWWDEMESCKSNVVRWCMLPRYYYIHKALFGHAGGSSCSLFFLALVTHLASFWLPQPNSNLIRSSNSRHGHCIRRTIAKIIPSDWRVIILSSNYREKLRWIGTGMLQQDADRLLQQPRVAKGRYQQWGKIDDFPQACKDSSYKRLTSASAHSSHNITMVWLRSQATLIPRGITSDRNNSSSYWNIKEQNDLLQ